MQEPEILRRFKELANGEKVTLILKDVFGNPFEHRATYLGEVEQHGYLSRGGGWGLYKIEGVSQIPCYRVKVKLYRKSQHVWLQLVSKITDFRLGWG